MTSSLAFQWTEVDEQSAEDQTPRLWLLENNWDLLRDSQFTHGERAVYPSPDAGVNEAARAMTQLDLDHIPVIEQDGKLVGLLTFTCLARVVRFGLETLRPGASVRDVMVENPVTIGPETELREALDTLRVHRFRFLPVVNPEGILLGSISSRDVLRVMSPQLEASLDSSKAVFLHQISLGSVEFTICPS